MRLRMQIEPHPSQSFSLRETGSPVNWHGRPCGAGPCPGARHCGCGLGSSSHTCEVSPKAHASVKLNIAVIDAAVRSRYSQGQIKDLVAYAIPRFLQASQSTCSFLRRESGNRLKPAASSPVLRPAAPCASTADNLFTASPGGSACGFARFISRLQRRTGGLRPL